MAEQQKRGQGSVGAELTQTGRAILRSPALTRGAEGAIRFLLGAVLAGGELFGGFAPFGVGLVGSSGSGMDGLCAVLGSVFGYLYFRGFTEGLRYAAACVLVFSVAFAFYDLSVYERDWFMPLVSGAMDAATGFVYLSGGGGGETVGFLLELALASGSTYLYRIAFSPWKTGEEGRLSFRQRVSLFFLAGTLLCALAGIELWGDVSLGRALGMALVMAVAHCGGLSRGAAAGVAVGVGMDLAAGTVGFYTMAYGLSGLLTGAGWRQGRLFGALTFVVANGAVVIWGGAQAGGLPALYECFLASVSFILLPQGVLRRLETVLKGDTGEHIAQRCTAYLSERLNQTARAFRAVRDSLRVAFPNERRNDEDPAKIFDRAAQRVCGSCALRNTCWGKEHVNTYNALNDALGAMLTRGKGESGDFPSWFVGRCIHFIGFLNAANEELVAMRYRQQYKSRLRENRGAVCRQYETLSDILTVAAAELSAELVPDFQRDRRLKGYLARLGVEGETAVYYDEAGHLRVEVDGDDAERLQGDEQAERLSRLMGVSLRFIERVPARVVLTQTEPLMAVAGVAARRREGQTESGDSGTWFKRNDGSMFVLLCDGMGSGQAALRESALAVRLLEEFLRSGMESRAALRTVNSALALRNEEAGAFTTVDLMRIDLHTGQGEVCKLGAAPTYLRREGRVSRIVGTALPAGLTDHGREPDEQSFTLKAGDWALLISDGVADAEEDGWLRELLEQAGEDSPRELARRVMEESERRVGAGDDRTAVVLQIKERERSVSQRRNDATERS